MVILLTKMWVKPDKVFQFKDTFAAMAKGARQEKDCIAFNLFQDMQIENLWFTVGRWTKPEALHEFMTASYFKTAMTKNEEFFIKNPEFSLCHEIM